MRSATYSMGAAFMVFAGTASRDEVSPRAYKNKTQLELHETAEFMIEIDKQRDLYTALSSHVHKPAMLCHRLPLHCTATAALVGSQHLKLLTLTTTGPNIAQNRTIQSSAGTQHSTEPAALSSFPLALRTWKNKPRVRIPTPWPNLPIPPIRLRVMSLPRLPPPRRRLIELMSLAQPSALLPRSRQSPTLTMLVHGFDDPVDA